MTSRLIFSLTLVLVFASTALAAGDTAGLTAGEEANHDLEIAGAVVGIIVLAILIF